MPDRINHGWRNDAVAKVTGAAKYADDLHYPGMLHAVPVYTEYVHATLIAIDMQEALTQAGVVTIITASDVPGTVRFGQIRKDLRILVDDKIRFHGDVVAIVVAETHEQAIAAAKFVRVTAQPLPTVLDPEIALSPDAPLIHEEYASNIINEHRIRRGNIEQGFAESDVIVDHTFQTQFIEHAYMEPESAVCIPRDDGVIEVHGSMQHPFSTRRFVATLLDLKLADVEVIGTAMGGGFGGKDDTAAIVCARTALAAKLTGKPVKMTYSREMSIRESYKRHPYRVNYRLGVKCDGTIQAVKCRIVADGGAYCSVTPWVTWRSTVQCCGPYVVPNVHCDTFGVYTNNVYTGAMRGFGSPQINFVVEQMIEMAAEKIGMSPIAMRRINMVRQGSETITGQTLDTHTVSMEQALQVVLDASDYERKLANCSNGNPEQAEWYGIGLAMSYRGMSLGAEGKDFCAAIINAQFDGSVLLEVGIHENGQGSESAFIRLLASELGIPEHRIRYRRSSTATIPDSGTTVASRGTLMGSGAVVDAATILKTKIASIVASRLSTIPEDIQFFDGNVSARSNGNAISFADAIAELYQQQEFPFAFGVYRAPRVSWEEETGQGDAYFTWVYGCQAVEVSVNATTGKVKVLNVVAAHDVGRAIHRERVLGQFYGGVAMGMGYALSEQVKATDGKITTLNFNTYRIPRATDVPEIQAIILENRDPVSRSGAKGIGEPTNELMAPAIANAIYNATGQRFFQLPITAKSIVNALHREAAHAD
ncbi:MAG: xanthine dehydrogenase family protein molybdopterin-binding subunit [bacterium]|nr:xanthine dehydrogenase family protein molybdopterin-binding subunit [bacterium]